MNTNFKTLSIAAILLSSSLATAMEGMTTSVFAGVAHKDSLIGDDSTNATKGIAAGQAASFRDANDSAIAGVEIKMDNGMKFGAGVNMPFSDDSNITFASGVTDISATATTDGGTGAVDRVDTLTVTNKPSSAKIEHSFGASAYVGYDLFDGISVGFTASYVNDTRTFSGSTQDAFAATELAATVDLKTSTAFTGTKIEESHFEYGIYTAISVPAGDSISIEFDAAYTFGDLAKDPETDAYKTFNAKEQDIEGVRTAVKAVFAF